MLTPKFDTQWPRKDKKNITRGTEEGAERRLKSLSKVEETRRLERQEFLFRDQCS